MTAESRNKNWSEEVFKFWFETLNPQDWYKKDEAIDAVITQRFTKLYAALSQSVPDECRQSSRAALAAVIVLDQMPRNMFRDSPKSFATDAAALALSESAIARGLDDDLNTAERQFLYMPYQHAEDPAMQVRSIELFAKLGDPATLDFAHRHKTIIDRFSRFPHRNAVLGRTSTAQEIAFLEQPGSSF